MTVVKHIIAPSSSTVPVVDGQLVVKRDTGRLYVDYGSSRIAISDVEYANSYPLAPKSDRLYVTPDGARLYHNGSYTELGVHRSVTEIPSATTSYTLSDGVYTHAPANPSTYTLPTPSDASVTHEVILTVDFTDTQTLAFEDSQGNAITPLDTLFPVAGDTAQYICWWDPVQSAWAISAMFMNVVQPDQDIYS